MEVFCGMGCSSSVTNMHPYKGPPVTCILLFVKHLGEGTVSGRYFHDAYATFT